MSDRRVLIGRRYALDQEVGRDVAAAFATATGDAAERYLTDGTAPPFAAVRYVAPLWRLVYQDPELSTQDQLVLHAEQRMLFARPIPLDEPLIAWCRVQDVVGFGFGDAAVIRSGLSDRAGRGLVSMASTLAMQGDSGFPPDRRRFHQPSRGSLVAEVARKFPADATVHYADAADDHNPLHLDDEAARAAGHPSRIVHGMCTLATGMTALADALSPAGARALRYVRVRFARPVLPETEVVYRAYGTATPGTYAVSAELAGRPVLKNAVLRLSGGN